MTEFTAEVVKDVLDANLGRVLHIEQQARWRPAWFATVERDGEQRVPVCMAEVASIKGHIGQP